MKKTPETDDLARGNHVVPTEWAEQLERERNELKHDFEEQVEVVRNLKVALQEVAKLSRTLRDERDEARAEIAVLRQDAQREAEHHDRMVGELERLYDQINK